jgi:CTP synthase
MQLAVIEAFRNIGGISDANSTEFDKNTKNPVICLITEWENNEGAVERRTSECDLGGTLRVGSYKANLANGSVAMQAYGTGIIQERHRHRYEFNLPKFGALADELGIVITGRSPDGLLTEVIERKDHPWFVAVQFHPEFKSRPLCPHPLFVSFINSAKTKRFSKV